MRTILIVDDEPDVVECFAILIETGLDARALKAASGKAALELLAANRVDVIITDYKMPEMNGLQFLAKARELAPGVPSLMFTAFPDDTVEREAERLGVFRFLSKSTAPDDVIRQVQQAIQARGHGSSRNRPPEPRDGLEFPEWEPSSKREGDGEGGAATFSWTLAGDIPAMEIDEPFGHEESKPGPWLHLI